MLVITVAMITKAIMRMIYMMIFQKAPGWTLTLTEMRMLEFEQVQHAYNGTFGQLIVSVLQVERGEVSRC